MPAYRDKLPQGQILALAIYVRAFALTPSGSTPPKVERPVPSARMSPEKIYGAYCFGCHDADGQGMLVRKSMPEIPNFTKAAWQDSRKDGDLRNSILNGKGKFMAPMKDKLGSGDVNEMVAFVRKFRGGKLVVKGEPQHPIVPPPPQEPAIVPSPEKPPKKKLASSRPSAEMARRTRAATSLYRQNCLICHGPKGHGTEMRRSMPMIPDFSQRAWQQQVTSQQLTASVLNGKGALMPAFQGRISTNQARDLVAYIRAFGPGRPASEVAPMSDFEKRFRELQEEWKELQKQMEKLSPRRPETSTPQSPE
jgi:mono/diheme cytochrome c family protein